MKRNINNLPYPSAAASPLGCLKADFMSADVLDTRFSYKQTALCYDAPTARPMVANCLTRKECLSIDGFMHVFRQRTLKQLMTDLSLKVVFEKD